MRQFHPNDSILFILAGVVILFIIAQSLFFLIRAYRHGQEIGISKEQMKKTIISTSIFTIAPAVAVLLGIITLSKFLGLPLPWLRLSVIGAITYELPAATSTANALGVSLSETIMDPKVYTAITWVMTLGIFPGLIWVPLFIKKIQGGLVKIKSKDSKWGDIFMTSLFLGMISALGVAPIFWTVGLIEVLTYVPMLGTGSSYLSFVTGNVTSIKAPAALSAMENAKVKPGSEEGEVISTIAVATSAIVTTIVIAIGVVLLVPLTPILDNPAIKPAFDNILPALFGGLAVVYISKNWKISIVPLIFMLSLFLLVPSLADSVGVLVPVGVIITIGSARILYTKGKL